MAGRRSRWGLLLMLGMLSLAAGRSATAAEHIRIGIVRTASPVFIAIDRQYWTAEGLDPELVFFDSAPPIAVAVASGDLDFGVTGLSGGLYNLGNTLRIIAASTREAPGFQLSAYLAAKGAYDKGLRSVRDFPGHTVAITQFGAPVHYDVLLTEKYHFDPQSMRIVPMPSNPAQIAALTGGTVDAAIVPASYALQAIDRGDIRLLGYVGDETPWQNGAAFPRQSSRTNVPVRSRLSCAAIAGRHAIITTLLPARTSGAPIARRRQPSSRFSRNISISRRRWSHRAFNMSMPMRGSMSRTSLGRSPGTARRVC